MNQADINDLFAEAHRHGAGTAEDYRRILTSWGHAVDYRYVTATLKAMVTAGQMRFCPKSRRGLDTYRGR